MFLATPLRLKLQLDESRHTVSLANSWKSARVIDGSVKASLKSSEAAAFTQLLADVRDYINTYLPHGGAVVTDFTLEYSIARFDDDGRAYVPTGVMSSHKMMAEDKSAAG
jgi:hypothetical protein